MGELLADYPADLLNASLFQSMELVEQYCLHLAIGILRRRGAAPALTLACSVDDITSWSSIAVPGLGLLAGTALIGLDPSRAGPAATPLLFACAVGVAVAVTALPVLGAILRETGLLTNRIGRDALGCAAINDLLLWILLAAILSMAQAKSVDATVLRHFWSIWFTC